MTKIVKSAFLGVCLAAMLQACDGTEVNHGTDGAVMPDGDVMMVDGGMDGGSVDGGNGCGFTHSFKRDGFTDHTDVFNGISFSTTSSCPTSLSVRCIISVSNDGSIDDYIMTSLTINDVSHDPGSYLHYKSDNSLKLYPGDLFNEQIVLSGISSVNLFEDDVNYNWNPLTKDNDATFTATFTCVP